MSEKRVEIVRAAHEHAESIAHAEREYIDCPWTMAQINAEIDSDSAVFLVALYGGEFAGYLSGVCAADECEISNIAVREEFRRRGIATSLFKNLFSQVRARGVKSVFLLVRADNIAAGSLYKALGFAPVGVRKAYYGDKAGVIMRLDL